MYCIHVVDLNSNEIIAELKTKSKTIAHDFMYDMITDSWNGLNCKVAIYDEINDYKAVAIPHYENRIEEAFEIISIKKLHKNYYCIPDANDVMYDMLDYIIK